MSEHARELRLTATPFNNLISPELFVCDLCTSVVTNPQQHFRVHEAGMWTKATSDIFTPFLLPQGESSESDAHQNQDQN